MRSPKLLNFVKRYRHYLSLGLASLFFHPVTKFANFYLQDETFFIFDDLSSLIFLLKWILIGALLIIIWAYILSIFDCVRGYYWLDSPYFKFASIFAIFLLLISFVELIISPY